MQVGVVSELWRYPFKSMAGERLEGLEVGPHGVTGDRRWAVEIAGRVHGAKDFPPLMRCRATLVDAATDDVQIGFPNGRTVRATDPATPRLLSTLLGRAVAVRRVEGGDGTPFVDAAHVLIVTTASLRLLEQLAGESVIDVRRFRPNILIRTDDGLAGAVEAGWAGRRLRIGDVELEAMVACPRCVMITHGFDDVPQDRSIARILTRELGGDLGILASVVTPGSLKVGDEAAVE